MIETSVITNFSYDLGFCIFDSYGNEVIELPKIKDVSFDFIEKKTNQKNESILVSAEQEEEKAQFSIIAEPEDILRIVYRLADENTITVLSFEYSSTFYAAVFSMEENASLKKALKIVYAYENDSFDNR